MLIEKELCLNVTAFLSDRQQPASISLVFFTPKELNNVKLWMGTFNLELRSRLKTGFTAKQC